MMSSAASGAADFLPSADSREGRRRAHTPSPGQTSSKPASRPSGSRSSSKLGGKGSTGPEGAQAARSARIRGAAAVRGAETEALGTDAVWETEEKIERPPPSDARRSLRLPCVKGDASTEQGVGGARGSVNESEAAAEGEDVGCRPACWGGGCLQSELIQFHIHRRLKRSGRMQRKASGEAQPASAAQAAEPVTQQNEALQDEIERLEDENEELKRENKDFVERNDNAWKDEPGDVR